MAKRNIDIEDLLVWAYRDQLAHWARTSGPRGYVDSVALVQAIAVVGCKIDRSPGYVAPPVHDDALAVVEAVELLAQPIQGLVARCASAGTRPDWKPDARWRWLPKMVWRGNRYRPDVWYSYEDNCNRPWLCPIVQRDAPTLIDGYRAMYIQWWSALKALVQDLDGRLGSSVPTGPFAPLKPWEQVGASVL